MQVLARWFGGNSQPPTAPTPAPQPGGASRDRPLRLARLASAIPPLIRPSPGPDTSDRVYFAATGHTLQGKFYDYWKSHGGLWLFRLPAFRGVPGGKRHRRQSPTPSSTSSDNVSSTTLSIAGTPNEVLLGLLGTYMVTGPHRWCFRPHSAALPSSPNQVYFDATGHSLGGAFLSYWNQYGGLPVFGYPLSEEFQEVSATDGKPYTVQYFERARFESASGVCRYAQRGAAWPARPLVRRTLATQDAATSHLLRLYDAK